MRTNSKERFLSKCGFGIVCGAWLITTIAYLFFFGLNTSLEATKYIGAANELLQKGSFSENRYWFYFLTTAFIAISSFFKCGLAGAFFLQALYNFFCYYWFYQALKKLFHLYWLPLLVIIYLLLFWPYQSWISYLYTESAFYSSILLLFSMIVLYPVMNTKNLIRIGIALLLVVISRPLGILFIAGTGLYILQNLSKKKRIAVGIFFLISVIISLSAIKLIFSSISDWSIIKPFIEENIICNLPSKKSNTLLQLSNSGNPLYQLWFYITHNPNHFFNYAIIKLKYFFGITRSYYSPAHNAFLLLNIIPVYILAIWATVKVKMTNNIKTFIWVTILLFALSVALQCDDWHNRFILAIYPLLVVLAAYGLQSLLNMYYFKTKKI